MTPSTPSTSDRQPSRPVGRSGRLDPLLAAVAAGDEAAFCLLYDAASPQLSRLVRRVVRDPAQAEEVCQEVFLEIWQTASRFDLAQGRAVGWMMTIAHHRAVDRVRSAQAIRRRHVRYEAANSELNYDSTADAAHQSLEAQRLRKALETLTAGQRCALELAYFDGYTHTEVAATLGLPLGTAKSRIRDGLANLRRQLNHHGTPTLGPDGSAARG